MTEEQQRQYKKVTRVFKLQAVENGRVPNANFELDKNTAYITGIQLSGPSKSKINFRGRFGLQIDKEEILEPDIPASQFLSSVGVPPRERFFPLDAPVNNPNISVSYEDKDNAAAPFGDGYQVDVILEVLLNR